MGGGQEDRVPTKPLHISHVDQPLATINRLYILAHFSLTLALLFYRASRLPQQSSGWPLVAWALLFFAELLLTFLWILLQAFKWRPVSRTVFPERLPEDSLLPPIDIFICTADPEKEPTMEVMNTVISAICLDYPSDKLHIYLSDDGGAPLTLYALKKSYSFAASWLPFCKRFNIETRCPEAYFSHSSHGGGRSGCGEFLEEEQRLKLMYESLKESVEKAKSMPKTNHGLSKKGEDHLPHIEVIQDEQETDACFKEQEKVPLLVYISREKRKSFPHHFKAGALNVLLRVSSTISNSPYILVLDCDMYCNNPTSARQAMCFHLDVHLSPYLAFVQFPQCFHNISKNDIYCAELRSIFKILWKGCDGLRGPILSGTGFYIKRNALYGAKPGHTLREEFDSTEISELKQRFGTSNALIASLRHNLGSSIDNKTTVSAQSEAMRLASCTYEIDTQWGQQIGFLYGSVVEDYYTGFHLHCRGWISTYCCPARQAFLGSVPINFNDTLVQNKRWASGLLEVGFSRFCPLTYGVQSRNSVLQCMSYAWLAFNPLCSFALLCYGTIPQLCFMKGISLFPHVSSPWFTAFGIVYASSLCQHLMEVFLCGGSLRMLLNEHRFWMIISVTSNLFACLSLIMKLVGIGEIKFDLTNKVTGEEQVQRYENGIFDFEGSSMVLTPLTTLTILNFITLIRGAGKMIVQSTLHEMCGQLLLSLLIFVISYPVLEGIITRRDKGRVPAFITMISIIFAVVLLLFFELGV